MLQAIASAARSLVACVCIEEAGRKHRKQQDVVVHLDKYKREQLLAKSVDWDQLALVGFRFAHQHDNLYQFEAQHFYQANLRLPTQPKLHFEAQLKPH